MTQANGAETKRVLIAVNSERTGERAERALEGCSFPISTIIGSLGRQRENLDLLITDCDSLERIKQFLNETDCPKAVIIHGEPPVGRTLDPRVWIATPDGLATTLKEMGWEVDPATHKAVAA